MVTECGKIGKTCKPHEVGKTCNFGFLFITAEKSKDLRDELRNSGSKCLITPWLVKTLLESVPVVPMLVVDSVPKGTD